MLAPRLSWAAQRLPAARAAVAPCAAPLAPAARTLASEPSSASAEAAVAKVADASRGRFVSGRVWEEVLTSFAARPSTVPLMPALWSLVVSSGCPVPPSAFPEAVVRRDLKLFLGAVAAMTAADVPISHDTWSALFRTAASSRFDPTVNKHLHSAANVFQQSVPPTTWRPDDVANLISALSAHRLHVECLTVLQTMAAAQPRCLTPDVVTAVLGAVARRASADLSTSGYTRAWDRTLAVLRRRGVDVTPGHQLQALRAAAHGRLSKFLLDRLADKGLCSAEAADTASMHAVTAFQPLVAAVVQAPAASQDDKAEAMGLHARILLRAGAFTEAAQQLHDMIELGLRPSTAVFNAFLLSSAGRSPDAAACTLTAMSTCGAVPDGGTLLNAVKCFLYSSADGTGAAAFVQRMSTALDVPVTNRVLGTAAFYAAKMGNWDEVDAVIAVATDDPDLHPLLNGRWKAKVDVLRRRYLDAQ